MIYHRTIENTDTHYKTLWSEEGNSRFFVVSATNDPNIDVNETMCFASDSEGQIISWRDLATSYPASRDQREHETLASKAYDESAKEVMGISGGPSGGARPQRINGHGPVQSRIRIGLHQGEFE